MPAGLPIEFSRPDGRYAPPLPIGGSTSCRSPTKAGGQNIRHRRVQCCVSVSVARHRPARASAGPQRDGAPSGRRDGPGGCSNPEQDRPETLEGETSGAGCPPTKFFRHRGQEPLPLPTESGIPCGSPNEVVVVTLDTGASNVMSVFRPPSLKLRRTSPPSLKLRRVRSEAPFAGEGRPGTFAALTRAHVVM